MNRSRILTATSLAVVGLLFLTLQFQDAGAQPPVQATGVPELQVGSRLSSIDFVSGQPAPPLEYEVIAVVGEWVNLRTDHGRGNYSDWWVNLSHVTMFMVIVPQPEGEKK